MPEIDKVIEEFDKKFYTTVGAEGLVFVRWLKKESSDKENAEKTKDLKDWIVNLLKEREREVRLTCIQEIEDARQEHNDSRHGDSADDAYDRACDAVNPDLKNLYHTK